MSRSSFSAWAYFVAVLAAVSLLGCSSRGGGGGGPGNVNGAGNANANANGAANANENANGVGNANENANGVGNANGNDNGTGNANENDNGGPTGLIAAGHLAAANFDSIPATFVTQAKSNYRIFYGHTSHGSQIVTGMGLIADENANYGFTTGQGAFLEEDDGVDLGYEGDLGWVDTTRQALDRSGSTINLVMWSWCGGVSDNTEAGINTYLQAMNQLEADYPQVTFVYMTGHLDGTGDSGNLRARNNQIRAYCQTNNKILYDFADIESYDPAGTYYPNETDWCNWCETWCSTPNACPVFDCVDDNDCQHSVCFNCYRKGQAFWWMMARIAGWDGQPE
jgi:hypothetical protein